MNMAKNVIYLSTSMRDLHTTPNLCSVVLDMKHAHNLQSTFSFHALSQAHHFHISGMGVNIYSIGQMLPRALAPSCGPFNVSKYVSTESFLTYSK
jgi:hypothetical protein